MEKFMIICVVALALIIMGILAFVFVDLADGGGAGLIALVWVICAILAIICGAYYFCAA